MMNVDSSESIDRKPKVSNLTKNLLNQNNNQSQNLLQQNPQTLEQQMHQQTKPEAQPQQQTQSQQLNSSRHSSSTLDHGVSFSAPNNPPSYESIDRFSSTNHFVPQSATAASHTLNGIGSTSSSHGPPSAHSHIQSASFNQFSSFNPDQADRRNSSNYIPSSHNTPNMVSSSYSSNHSYNKYNFQPSHSIPTTNVTVDNNFIPNFQRNPLSFNSVPNHYSQTSSSVNAPSQPHQQSGFVPQAQENQTHSRPESISQVSMSSSMSQNPMTASSRVSVSGSSVSLNRPAPFHHHSFTTNDHLLTNITPTPPHSYSYITEPDHYMTYNEFYNNLNSDSADEDHINIVDYPVNDLILMLSCLLTKIIEANDKLHPNHFDSTIAIRQKLKEEKRMKKMMKLKQRQDQASAHQGEISELDQPPNEPRTHVQPVNESNDSNINVNEAVIENESSDDEEDEMKNKYLANVLAFHGTNVPGISLHAYLSRVLKYCPVTNEVFLSLLVYFDRIAKKANNLKKDNKDSESEQLFVMDSYNIHRLIISGITVSSKFFSDIFYKNLRYAKVGGLPLEELNYLELQFLLLLDFKLMISVEDLQNYGDLLLRFWKREQITNELVHDNNSNNTNNQAQAQQNPQPEPQPMTQIPTPTTHQS